MRCTLLGKEKRAGESKKGKYDFVRLYIAGSKSGVDGQATDDIFLSRDRHPALCESVEKLAIGELIEVFYSREIGSNIDVVTDIISCPSLDAVE